VCTRPSAFVPRCRLVFLSSGRISTYIKQSPYLSLCGSTPFSGSELSSLRSAFEFDPFNQPENYLFFETQNACVFLLQLTRRKRTCSSPTAGIGQEFFPCPDGSGCVPFHSSDQALRRPSGVSDRVKVFKDRLVPACGESAFFSISTKSHLACRVSSFCWGVGFGVVLWGLCVGCCVAGGGVCGGGVVDDGKPPLPAKWTPRPRLPLCQRM